MGHREFDNLVTTSSEFLKPFAVTLTKDTGNAEDLLQDTMLRALANKDKYHVGTNIKAWLYTIMRNIFINNYRRQAKQQLVFDRTADYSQLDQPRFAIYNAAETNLRLKEIWQAV